MRRSCYLAFSLTLSFLVGCNDSELKQDVTPVTKLEALTIATSKYQIQADMLDVEDGYPREYSKGYHWEQIKWQDWTNGFFPGALWMLSTYDNSFIPQAEKWTLSLKEAVNFNSHDLGFMFNNTFGLAYRLTENESYKPTLIQAADNLLARYNSKVGAIRSWDFGHYKYPVIIDNMMNLDLLWAVGSSSSELQVYRQVATQHAETAMQNHLRVDGSTYHLIDYNPDSGEVIDKETVQGYNDSSTWSRGQAWAIYGFTQAYYQTKQPQFLASAQLSAEYFLENLPEDNVPPWDFSPEADQSIKDSSAAAVAASALWQLGEISNNQRYKQRASDILSSLLVPKYFYMDTDTPALLKLASGNVPAGREVNTSLIYADYYFIEALLLQLGYIDWRL
ncbi:glycoside hydrolase family 88 protein [Vibrio diabolicus]|uniref:glycoside hydrolase family 88 protein n=1 Tax=Vibrio diabolicus TaxID=50719 RepID=UPI0015F57270|nr:glycoside hydrolase family 88 protein [Vibrio diabolicus]